MKAEIIHTKFSKFLKRKTAYAVIDFHTFTFDFIGNWKSVPKVDFNEFRRLNKNLTCTPWHRAPGSVGTV
jgi:hypothetical protein